LQKLNGIFPDKTVLKPTILTDKKSVRPVSVIMSKHRACGFLHLEREIRHGNPAFKKVLWTVVFGK